MTRIPLFPQAEMSPEQDRVFREIVSGARGALVGPLRAALHRAELADKWQQLGELLRYRTGLTPRLSELAILVTARHWDAQLEWHVHAPLALKAGLSADSAESIRCGRRPVFALEDEQVVHDYVAELLASHKVGEALYQRALELLAPVGMVELTALVGYYSMVALTLNAHEIPLPDDAEPQLPPVRTGVAS